MNVLLVDPLIDSANVYPSLGLMYIAAVLENTDLDVNIMEMCFLKKPWVDLEKILSSLEIEIVGVTSTTFTFPDAVKVAKTVKAVSKDSTVISGGIHATFTAIETLQSIPEFDIVVVGEGERTMLELCRTLNSDGDIGKVNGIAFRKNGEIIKTPQRAFIRNLDTLPFPNRNLVSMKKYREIENITPLATSRGCPYKCVFCASRAMWGQIVRLRSPNSVVDEIEEIIENHNFDAVSFTDDVFTINKKRTYKICAEILNRGLNVEWECSTRTDLLTRDLLQKMKKAGCRAVFMGIETGTQQILNTLNKGTTLKQAEKAVKWARKADIESRLSFMLGCPEENKKMSLKTLEFAEKLVDQGADTVCFSFLKPYPGTQLAMKPEKFGITYIDRDWRKYGSPLTPVCETVKLKIADLYFLALRASKMEYYLSEIRGAYT